MLVTAARARGLLTLKLTPMGSAGYPDRLLLGKGVVAFVEVKRPGEKLRPLQERRHADLQALGFVCGTFDASKPVSVFLDNLLWQGKAIEPRIDPPSAARAAAIQERATLRTDKGHVAPSETRGVLRAPLSATQTKQVREATALMSRAQELMRAAFGGLGLVTWKHG